MCRKARAIAHRWLWWLRQSKPKVKIFPSQPLRPAGDREVPTAWDILQRVRSDLWFWVGLLRCWGSGCWCSWHHLGIGFSVRLCFKKFGGRKEITGDELAVNVASLESNLDVCNASWILTLYLIIEKQKPFQSSRNEATKVKALTTLSLSKPILE